jgi:hypothetical protein
MATTSVRPSSTLPSPPPGPGRAVRRLEKVGATTLNYDRLGVALIKPTAAKNDLDAAVSKWCRATGDRPAVAIATVQDYLKRERRPLEAMKAESWSQ